MKKLLPFAAAFLLLAAIITGLVLLSGSGEESGAGLDGASFVLGGGSPQSFADKYAKSPLSEERGPVKAAEFRGNGIWL